MSDPALGLTMLCLIVVVILMGFPTAFTLMGLGTAFGFYAFYDPSQHWIDNKIFDLMVQRAYGAMTNDTLISVPLFVLMGYVMERGALVDKMFYSFQLAFRRVPASLAVASLIVCTFWGIASGLVGAVVVLMGVIAFNPMLKAGYDTRLAAGVITAGGTLGILIPPSVMIIVYAAVAGQSVVKLYASAMFPGFFLALLYLVYIVGWALINPKVAPKLPVEKTRIPVAGWTQALQQSYSKKILPALLAAVASPKQALAIQADGIKITYGFLWKNLTQALVPFIMAAVTLWGVWWYVVIHPQADVEAKPAKAVPTAQATPADGKTSAAPTAKEKAEEVGSSGLSEPPSDAGGLQEPPSTGDSGLSEPPGGSDSAEQATDSGDTLQEMGGGGETLSGATPAEEGPSPTFFIWFWCIAAAVALLLVYYYWIMEGELFELLKLLVTSTLPLAILTLVVLAVILFGITTATESAAVGAAGAFLLAWQAKSLNWQKTKEATFLTAKTTAMVCWLFVGSAIFSAVFAILGGQALVEQWVLSMNLTPMQFMLLSQAIIFILGWPLEWTEIIVIFVPIFLPLLKHFSIDPILWGTLVFVNLQAAFLSPPVAMSAFYLKGVAPKHVTINQIFAGMMPYMLIVIVCMMFMYLWPSLTLWLPNYLYGAGG
jgi:TRAP-type mannitol/chloroaromatic compound transport system permease large subunit